MTRLVINRPSAKRFLVYKKGHVDILRGDKLP